MTLLSIAGFALATIYCFIRGTLDLREKRYVWGLFGILAAAAIATVPVPPHAVKIVLPQSSATR